MKISPKELRKARALKPHLSPKALETYLYLSKILGLRVVSTGR
jgi:hypothetical protein